MGKAGNKRRQETRRSIEQSVVKKEADKLIRAAQAAEQASRKRTTQEQLELERAYGPVDYDGPAPWEDQGDGRDALGNPIIDKEEDWKNDWKQGGTQQPVSMDMSEVAKAGPPRNLDTEVRSDIRMLPPPANDDNKEERWRVTVIKETLIEFPELYMEIFVAGPRWDEAKYAELFARSYCCRAKSCEEADLVIFTGGEDINPFLYNEEPHEKVRNINDQRDSTDALLYHFCKDRGIPMLGVCRGAQFLHVMNGGKLYQHVDKHYGDHKIVDVHTKQVIDKVSSVHHQMVIPQKGMTLLATSNEATERWLNPKECHRGSRAEVEAFFYEDTLCLGVQGHPEYRDYYQYARWVVTQVEECFLINDKLDWQDGHRRLKPEFLKTGGKK